MASSRFHEVRPLATCAHAARVDPRVAAAAGAACRVCSSNAEPWTCLECGHVGCGRDFGGHAAAHAAETGHAIALGSADLVSGGARARARASLRRALTPPPPPASPVPRVRICAVILVLPVRIVH